MLSTLSSLIVGAAAVSATVSYPNEYKLMPGHVNKEFVVSPLPSTYIKASDVPQNFYWGNNNGVSYLTKNLNQHIPQYCGSCWAHGAISALGDRIKIARAAKGNTNLDIDLSIQYILNCGAKVAGSCYGGSASGTYDFIKNSGLIPFDTAMPYSACSSDSTEGFCGKADWTCTALNKARTCGTFGVPCVGLSAFPNATVAEHGEVQGEAAIMAEVFARGPVACVVDANPLRDYNGGIVNSPGSTQVDHIVSITGWGVDAATNTKYWIVRNSWGEFWGEMGSFRVVRGQNQLLIESGCSWATPGQWTEQNFPCFEDGSNCVATAYYVDPSVAAAARK